MAMSWLNTKTANLCGDHPERPPVNEPVCRPILRCSLAVASVVAAAVVITVLFLANSDEFRTVRTWHTEFVLTPNAWEIDYSKTLCPCNKTFAPWPVFVHFYWVDQHLHRENITNNTQVCDPLINGTGTSPLWMNGCYNMASAGFDTNGTRLTVPSSTLQGPESLSYLISSSFRTYVDEEFSKYQLLAANYSGDWLQLRWVHDILQNTASRAFMLAVRKFLGNTTLTDQVFWNHTRNFMLLDPRHPENNTMSALVNLTGGHALSMEMDWTGYAKWCTPLYCDSVVTNSRLRRFVLAVGEVGGFSTVMLFFIRGLIWPLLRQVFHFNQYERLVPGITSNL